MLICIECSDKLMEIPIYNNDRDEEFPPTFLFCNNKKCKRFGLLTVTFRTDETKKSKHKKL